jgi:hypothetical protein
MGNREVRARNEWAGRKHVKISIGYNLYFLNMVRSALFWDITRCIVVISYRCLWTTYRSLVQGSRSIFLTLEDATDRFYPDVGKELPLRWEPRSLLGCQSLSVLGGAYSVELYKHSVKWIPRKEWLSRVCFRVHVTVLLINLFNLEHVTVCQMSQVCVYSTRLNPQYCSQFEVVTTFEESPGNSALRLADTRSSMRVELLLVKLKVRPECPPPRLPLSARVITIGCII